MEPEGSLPWSQQPSTGPYPKPDRSSPYQKLTTIEKLTSSALTSGYWKGKKHCPSVAVQLLLSDHMTYSNVAWAAIGTDCAENTIPLLLFKGRWLVTAGCCDSTTFAFSEYATIFQNCCVHLKAIWGQWSTHSHTVWRFIIYYFGKNSTRVNWITRTGLFLCGVTFTILDTTLELHFKNMTKNLLH
jgi:hypothetical protein